MSWNDLSEPFIIFKYFKRKLKIYLKLVKLELKYIVDSLIK